MPGFMPLKSAVNLVVTLGQTVPMLWGWESLISSGSTTTRNNKFQQRMPATNESVFTFEIALRPPRPSSAALSHNFDAEVSYAKPSQPKITAQEETSLPKLPLPTLICSTVPRISQRLFLQLQTTQIKPNAHLLQGTDTTNSLHTPSLHSTQLRC